MVRIYSGPDATHQTSVEHLSDYDVPFVQHGVGMAKTPL